MKEETVLDEVNRQRSPDHRFIKWWRREHDFLNFELLSEFEAHGEEGINLLEGFELLDTEEMWEELHRRFPDRVSREKRTKGEFLVWHRPDRETRECPFTPENLITIFNSETRGVVID